MEAWTFTTTGPLGDGRYYERIDDNGNPNDGHILDINNGGGAWDERSIVDAGFLDLVRLGVKRPNDPFVHRVAAGGRRDQVDPRSATSSTATTTTATARRPTARPTTGRASGGCGRC